VRTTQLIDTSRTAVFNYNEIRDKIETAISSVFQITQSTVICQTAGRQKHINGKISEKIIERL
jgi:hypothetical protein